MAPSKQTVVKAQSGFLPYTGPVTRLSNYQPVRAAIGFWLVVISTMLASTVARAEPTVEGLTISWPDDGWYQVQDADDFSNLCQGGLSCDVPPGRYVVINHTTSTRWENIVVQDSGGISPVVDTDYPGGLSVDGQQIDWQDDGWYQVQDASDYTTVCEGGRGCQVAAGEYIVINHSTGMRWNRVVVGAATGPEPGPDPDSGDIVVTGNILSWPDDGWYQVQNVNGFVSVCSGGSSCEVEPGTYQVINHTTGMRWEDIVVAGDDPVTPPVADSLTVTGNTIFVADDGWYQFQSAVDFQTLCEGVSSCTVEPGFYNVVNHSTGQRWDGVQVGDGGIIPDLYVVNPSDPFNALLEVPPVLAAGQTTPSSPQHLRVELISNEWVELNWAPSIDDGEIVAYNIYRDDFNTPLYVLRGDQTHPNSAVAAELQKYWQTTSFIDCNRTRFTDQVFFCDGGAGGEPARGPEQGGSYRYRVSAVDEQGNESPLSEELAVQLFDASGSDLQRHSDPHAPTPDAFPFDVNLASPQNYLDQFELVFEDEFDAAELNTAHWNSRLTWGPAVTINDEKQYFVDILNQPDFGYDPFSFTGSTLKISAIATPEEKLVAADNKRYLSGALSSYDKFGFTYGYVESRIKVSGVFGALSTFYLYHRYAAEQAPEIDIVEYLGYNQFGDEDMFQTYHYRDVAYTETELTRSSPTMSVQNPSGAQYSDSFHTYGVLWEPGLVVWYIDGIEVKRLQGPQISRQRMNLVTYLVTGSAWTKAPDEYVVADELVEQQTDEVVNLPFKLESDFPLEMEIDYIKVWQRPQHRG